jgi:hypothetical protein
MEIFAVSISYWINQSLWTLRGEEAQNLLALYETTLFGHTPS